MCVSTGQNGAYLIKMAREEIGLQPRSKVILRHAQQDFETIYSEVFLFSRARKKSLLSGLEGAELRFQLRSFFGLCHNLYLFA